MSDIVLTTDAPNLPRYEQACRAVAEARTVDEVREIAANADALRAYAKQAKNRQLELDAAEIRIRAERRLGEIMAAQRDTVGVNKGGGDHRVERKPGDPATLAEAGIDKNLAHRARALAGMVSERFEALLDDKRQREDPRLTLDLEASRAAATSLKAENATLKQRVAELEQENRTLKGLVMRWKERAMIAEEA
jgi:hypothetical protein